MFVSGIYLTSGRKRIQVEVSQVRQERLIQLSKDLTFLRSGGSSKDGCDKCGTNLHGEHPCPFGKLSNKKARTEGRKALQQLAEGKFLLPKVEKEKEGKE